MAVAWSCLCRVGLLEGFITHRKDACRSWRPSAGHRAVGKKHGCHLSSVTQEINDSLTGTDLVCVLVPSGFQTPQRELERHVFMLREIPRGEKEGLASASPICYFIIWIAFIRDGSGSLSPILLTSEHPLAPLTFHVFLLSVLSEIAR